jgi:hypothetical protein
VLVPIVLLLVSARDWMERGSEAFALAAESARAAAVAPDWETALEAVAVIERRAELRIAAGFPSCPAAEGCVRISLNGALARGGVVTARASVWVPPGPPLVPGSSGAWSVAAHSEPVDRYRSLP